MKQHAAHQIAFDFDGVQRTVDTRQQLIIRHERRVYAELHPIAVFAADRQQLDGVPEVASIREVALTELRDPLTVDVVGMHVHVERQPGKDAQFVRGVDAFDIVRRICFSEAQRLRVRECIRKRTAAFAHGAEDVVRCAVDDRRHADDIVR